MLSDQVTLKQHILQNGNMAAFVASLYHHDFDLMRRSLQDLIIEPQRKQLIPEFDACKELALGENALGFGISGAGPSMYCLCQSTIQAEHIQEKIARHFADQKLECDLYISKINQRGAFKY